MVGWNVGKKLPPLFLSLVISLSPLARVPACAQQGSDARAIDPDTSLLTVKVFRSGLFSFFAHDHVITARGLEGAAETGEHPSVSFELPAGRLTVLDAGLSDKDRAEVQETMEGEKVLNIVQFPKITFQSTSCAREGADRWLVKGNLTLHGTTRSLSFMVRHEAGRYKGKTKLRQTDFGIKPIKIAGGAVSVKDDVEVEFDVRLMDEP